MERRGQVDAPGVASNLTRLSSSAILTFFLLISAASGSAQDNFADVQLAEKARQLFTEQRWQEVVTLVESARSPSADLDFYYGSALAQLGRLADARQAFAAGSRLQPHDKRFPSELAGVAFKQKDYPRAARYLRRALHLDPHDAYGNDFLGTVYFLQGNIEAALKCWNRVNKPAVAEARTVPTPRVSASLLDRAFTFAPASSLQLADLLTSDVRTRGLGIFPSQQFDLQARDDGKFDVLFRNREREGGVRRSWKNYFSCFAGCHSSASLPSITTCGGRRSISLPCIAGMRRSAGFPRSSQVRSGGIRSSATDCWLTCAAKIGIFVTRFRARLRCWEV